MISFSFMALFLIHVLIHKFIDSSSKSPQDSLTLFLSTCNKFYCGQNTTLFINFICSLKILCKGFDHIYLPNSSNIHPAFPIHPTLCPNFQTYQNQFMLSLCSWIYKTVVELTRTTLLR